MIPLYFQFVNVQRRRRECSVSSDEGVQFTTAEVFNLAAVFILLKANGDSMVDAGIDDGDWIVIKRQNFADEGDIIVALFEGMNNLKYFFRDTQKGCAILRSANDAKNYADIEVYDLRIQGVAQNVIKAL